MNLGTIDWAVYASALSQRVEAIKKFGPDCLIISPALDTFKKDPMASFKLTSADYLGMGEVIASLRLSTHFVFEGGYAIDKPGVNTANVLIGFEGFRAKISFS